MTNPKPRIKLVAECNRLVRRLSDASYTQGIDEGYNSPSRDQKNSDKVCALLAETRAAIDRLGALAEAAIKERDDRTDTIVNVGRFLGIDPDWEEKQPGYDPKGPASATIIRAIQRLAAVQPVCEWVSVTERLPAKYVEVLIAFRGSSLASTGQYTGLKRDPGGWSYPSENGGDATDWTVTHWSPLPDVPAKRATTQPEPQR